MQAHYSTSSSYTKDRVICEDPASKTLYRGLEAKDMMLFPCQRNFIFYFLKQFSPLLLLCRCEWL